MFVGERKEPGSFLSSHNYYDFLDRFTLLEGSESMENNGNSRQLQKLFVPLARHPRSLPGGGNDCDIHDERRTTGDRRPRKSKCFFLGRRSPVIGRVSTTQLLVQCR